MNYEARLSILCRIAECQSCLGDYRSAIETIKSINDYDKNIEAVFILCQNLTFLNELDEAKLVIESMLNSDTYKACENKEKNLLELFEAVESKKLEYQKNKEEYSSFPKFENFYEWIRSNRFSYFPKMELKFFSDCHRGVFARRKIYVKS